jgi:hypothetical protein
MGRPRIVIDYELVKELAEIQCTIEEIAHIFKVSDTKLRQDNKFQTLYKEHVAQGNKSLRRKQFEVAMNGNTSMLIWLGKQRLGQVDRSESNITASSIGIIWADDYGERENASDNVIDIKSKAS